MTPTSREIERKARGNKPRHRRRHRRNPYGGELLFTNTPQPADRPGGRLTELEHSRIPYHETAAAFPAEFRFARKAAAGFGGGPSCAGPVANGSRVGQRWLRSPAPVLSGRSR
jgi:hypothetical protein